MKRIVTIFGMLLVLVAGAPAFAGGFADMVDRNMPAVVTVVTSQSGNAPRAVEPKSSNPLDQLQKQFPFLNPHGNGETAEGSRPTHGSGFIISADGYVVTSHHVVAEADSITVTLGNGRELEADLVGGDQETDLALLKVDVEHALPFVSFGNSDRLRLGDWVVAIGNPLSVGRSVTAGILSGRGRQREVGNLDDLLQTDVAITLGNSGGPLFNEQGDVIGVVAFRHAEAARRGAGIAFAIPSARADVIIRQLKDHGRPIRAWLGVAFRQVDPYLAEAVGLKRSQGALVESVVADSPAARAGIQSGDIILSFKGKTIQGANDLPWIVSRSPIGKAAWVEIWRDGRARRVAVELAEKPGAARAAISKPGSDLPRASGQSVKALGITFREVNQQAAEQFGWDSDIRGVYVHRIDPTAPAASLNLRPGDLVEEVEDTRIESPRQLADLIKRRRDQSKKGAVLLKIRRGGNVTYVGLPLKGPVSR